MKLHQIAIWKNKTLFANVPANNDVNGVHHVTHLPWEVKQAIIKWYNGATYLTQKGEWMWGWKNV